MVLKELIFNSSTFNGCDGLERAYSLKLFTLGSCGGLERTDF